jgi:hypothetical protein
MEDKSTRRSFFKLALMGVVTIPLIAKSAKLFAADACPSTPPTGKALAQPNEGMGKTLEYVMDAKTSKNAKYKAGNSCANCKFYNAAKAEGGYAPCTMLGMKYVTNCGWCKSYSPKV